MGISMINKLLSLLQLCDSNFPSGAFSHSFGLETYIYEQGIHNTITFQAALHTYMDTQVTYTDGLACRLAYEYVKEGNIEMLWELDAMLSALALARETREGNRRIGERLVKLCSVLYSEFVLLAEYEQRIRRKEAYGHPAIAFALVAYDLEINQRETIAAYIYSVVQSLIQNAVRAVPLGQTDGQKQLLFVQPLIQQAVQKIEKADAEELGMTSPGLEIAQMRHEHLPVRLFMS